MLEDLSQYLYPDQSNQVVSGPTLDNRAARFDMAMGERSPGYEELRQQLSAGNEDYLRTQITDEQARRYRSLARSLVVSTVEGNITNDPILVNELSKIPDPAPESAMEEEFTQKALDITLALSNNTRVQDTINTDSMKFGPRLEGLEKQAIRENIMQTKIENWSAKLEALGWKNKAYYIGKGVIPYVSWYNLIRGSDETTSKNPAAGHNMLARADQIWAMDPNDMAKAIDEEMAVRWAVNPLDAANFMNTLQFRSQNEATFNDLIFAVDLTILPWRTAGSLARAAGKGLVRGYRPIRAGSEAAAEGLRNLEMGKAPTAIEESTKAVEDITKVISKPGATAKDVMEVAGNHEEAATLIAKDNVKAGVDILAGKAAPPVQEAFARMAEQTPLPFNPNVRYSGASGFATKYATELQDRAMMQLGLISKALRAHGVVSTLTPDQMSAAVEAAKEAFVAQNKDLAAHIRGTPILHAPEHNFGVALMETNLGTKTGAFSSFDDALQAAKNKFNLPEGSFKIDQTGTGFYVKLFHDVPETGVEAIDTLFHTKQHASDFHSLFGDTFGTYMKKMLGEKTKVSPVQEGERAAVVMAQTGLENAIRELARPIENLYRGSKKEFRDFVKMVNIGRTTERVPGDAATRGVFYRTDGELAQQYMLHFKRMPTQAETDAYFTYAMLSDLDWISRSIGSWKQGSKLGFNAFEINALDQSRKPLKLYVEGKKVFDIPRISQFVEFTKEGVGSLKSFKGMKKADREAFVEKLKSGKLTLIKRRSLERDELEQLTGNQQPLYVLMHDVRETPLRVDKQVNYSPGGHIVYKNRFFAKQPRFVDGEYAGDTAIFNFATRAETEKHAKALQTAITLSKAKDKTAFLEHLRANTPFTPEEWTKWRRSGHITDTPVAVVEAGQYTAQPGVRFVTGDSFATRFANIDVNATKEYEGVYGHAKDFTQAKTGPLQTVVKGGEGDPLWKLQDATMLDPIATQVSTMRRLIKDTLYQDYQFQAARAWVEEYGIKEGAPGLKYGKEELTPKQLRTNPLYYLANAEVASSNPVLKSQAAQIRGAIKRLLGTPSNYALSIDQFKYKLADTLFLHGNEKAARYISDKELAFIRDPGKYLRAVAFHTKLGFFNPVQLTVQSSTYLNALAVSPRYALKSTATSAMMMKASITSDEATLRSIARISEATGGLSEKQFMESRKWIDTFGIDTVGHEYAWLDNASDAVLYRGTAGHVFLDKGPMFFNTAERYIRMNGWNTAYLEFLQAHPEKLGKLTVQDAKQVLTRSQAYFANMTRDANAFWQRGLTGNLTQFFAYNARQLELMVGRQLTPGEKLRLGIGWLAAYGSPLSAAMLSAIQHGDLSMAETGIVSLGGMNPFAEDVRDYALKHGYNLDEGVQAAMYHGMSAQVLKWITGDWYNVGERYGVGPVNATENIKRNINEYGVMGGLLISSAGASGNIMSEIISSTYPVAKDIWAAAGGQDRTALTFADGMKVAREFSSINVLDRTVRGVLGMTYWSKNGFPINTDYDPLGEAFKALSGLSTIDEVDVYRKAALMRNRKDYMGQIKKELGPYRAAYFDAINSMKYSEAYAINKQIEAILASYPLSYREKVILQTIDSHDSEELQDAQDRAFERVFPIQEGLE